MIKNYLFLKLTMFGFFIQADQTMHTLILEGYMSKLGVSLFIIFYIV